MFVIVFVNEIVHGESGELRAAVENGDRLVW